ncbi:MAG TPA: tetratricopeptide repeat protein, partial [Burkholderiales bacterium]|nr:tetratricopeptide repeat protein [Burkholderiales bacterium]
CHTDRRDAEAWFMLAAAHQELGNFAQAADTYRQVIALDPDHVEAHYYLGNTCLALGDGPGAIVAFREATRLQPGHRQAHVNLGALLDVQHNYTAAETSLRAALQLEPSDAELHYNLGNVLQAQNRFEEAVDAYRQAQALRPNDADSHCNLGNALTGLGRYDEALICFEQALKLNPNLTAAHNNLGNTLAQMNRYDEAIACYRRALAINPRYADAQTNLGNVQRYRGELRESIASHRQAIGMRPEYADAHFNLAFALLVAGQFREGWQEYPWHWKREGGQRRSFAPSAWDGTDLDGRPVFLHAEQGLGDEIFFLRFALKLKRRGAGRITYRPHRKIASLLSRTPVIDAVADPDAVSGTQDWVFSVGDLPRLLGMERMDQIPSPLPLVPLPEKLDSLRVRLAELGPPPYVGVTWRAGIAGKELVLYKECPLHDLARSLKDVPGTILILQRQPQPGEIESFTQELGRPVHDFTAFNDDLEQMLALMALIDEYVGVSNTNMHLRAGVGKTARVLVPSPPEWRWMAEGKESPWFPGFSVYRQGYDGDWGDAITKLTADLQNPQGLR